MIPESLTNGRAAKSQVLPNLPIPLAEQYDVGS